MLLVDAVTKQSAPDVEKAITPASVSMKIYRRVRAAYIMISNILLPLSIS